MNGITQDYEVFEETLPPLPHRRTHREPEPPRVRGAIAKRIREVRNDEDLSQEVFAEAVGMTRHSLANVENERAVLSTRPAIAIAEMFDVSIVWLATGKGPKKPYVPLPRELFNRIRPYSRFYSAYATLIEPVLLGINAHPPSLDAFPDDPATPAENPTPAPAASEENPAPAAG